VRSISVILPAFNEAENIGPAIQRTIEVCGRLGLDFEVIVVDDGSSDPTADLASRCTLTQPAVRLIRHPRNRGYGAALWSGIAAARKDYIFFTDADLQFDIAELKSLLQWASSYDIIAGYRVERADPWLRRFNAWAWGRLMTALFDLRVRDIDCAFKLFHRRVFDAISIQSIGAFVNTEILVRARAEGFSIHEVSVSHFPRKAGSQTGGNPRVVLRAFLEVFKLYRTLRGLRRSDCPVADTASHPSGAMR